jgi:hypothetical protein
MTLILAYKNRGLTRDITILDVDSVTITPGGLDKLRVIIGREGKTAKLTVTSDSATSNGSSFTLNSPSSGLNRLRLDASDLDFDAGVYSLIVDYFDNADSQEWKNVDRQIFVLEDT